MHLSLTNRLRAVKLGDAPVLAFIGIEFCSDRRNLSRLCREAGISAPNPCQFAAVHGGYMSFRPFSIRPIRK